MNLGPALHVDETLILDEMPSQYWTLGYYIGTLGLWSIWRKRHRFILTNERVIVTSGILSKSERTVQLSKIQDVNVQRSLYTGGNITLSSAGGALSVRRIGPLTRAKAGEFAEAISELLLNQCDGVDTTSSNWAKKTSTADEIEKLTSLHGSGALTDEEFAAHKAKLLSADD